MIFFFLFLFLKQSLVLRPRLALNSQSPCLCLRAWRWQSCASTPAFQKRSLELVSLTSCWHCDHHLAQFQWASTQGSWAAGCTDLCGFNHQAWDTRRPYRHKWTLSVFTLVFCRRASPLQAFARRKSPLRIAILFPNCMSFSGPSEDCNSLKFTIPRCTRRAVCISSVISAKLLWLKHKEKVCISVRNVSLYDQCHAHVLVLGEQRRMRPFLIKLLEVSLLTHPELLCNHPYCSRQVTGLRETTARSAPLPVSLRYIALHAHFFFTSLWELSVWSSG